MASTLQQSPDHLWRKSSRGHRAHCVPHRGAWWWPEPLGTTSVPVHGSAGQSAWEGLQRVVAGARAQLLPLRSPRPERSSRDGPHLAGLSAAEPGLHLPLAPGSCLKRFEQHRVVFAPADLVAVK